MDTVLVIPIINVLQSLPAEGVSCVLFAICVIAMLTLLRLFGVNGLYIYNIVAILAANIQVLRGVQFSLSTEPVALGTVVFSTTYLCSDILTEHYGKEIAKRGVWLCFAAQLLMTLLMVVAVGYPPLPSGPLGNGNRESLHLTEQAMLLLFTPSPRLLFASLLAFVVSQLTDIWLFQTLRRLTEQRWLWFRTTFSAIIATVVDTCLFSLLAWRILAPVPVSFSVLIFTYILGTLLTRVFMSLLSSPVIYMSYLSKPLRPLYVR